MEIGREIDSKACLLGYVIAVIKGLMRMSLDLSFAPCSLANGSLRKQCCYITHGRERYLHQMCHLVTKV